MNLSPGQNISITKLNPNSPGIELLIKCEPQDQISNILACAALLNTEGKIIKNEDFVFRNQPISSDRAIRLAPEKNSFSVNFQNLATAVVKVAVVAILPKEVREKKPNHQIHHISTCLHDVVTQQRIASLPVNVNETSNTALILGELYRKNGEWKFRALSDGFEDGFKPLAQHFGLSIPESSIFAPSSIPDSTDAQAGVGTSEDTISGNPLLIPQIYKKAETLFESGQYKKAAILVELAATRNRDVKKDREVLYLLGASYVNLKKFEKAKEVFRSLLHQFPNHYNAALYLAKILKSEHKFDEARGFFYLAYGINPQLGYNELIRENLLVPHAPSNPPVIRPPHSPQPNPNPPRSRGDGHVNQKSGVAAHGSRNELQKRDLVPIEGETVPPKKKIGDEPIINQKIRRPGDPGNIILQNKRRRFSSYLTHWSLIIILVVLGCLQIFLNIFSLPNFSQYETWFTLSILAAVLSTFFHLLIDRIMRRYTFYEGLIEFNIGLFMSKHVIWLRNIDDVTIDTGGLFGLYFEITNTAQIILTQKEKKTFIKAIASSEEMEELQKFLRNQIIREKWTYDHQNIYAPP